MKTKIISTIGPSSDSLNTLTAMKKSGMSIARINTKYASKEASLNLINKLKKLKIKVLIDIKGLKNLSWICKHNFDYLAISYTESQSQINSIKKHVPKDIKIISKIESKKGIKNIDSIIKATDGIMIARGDLSKNLSYEKVPVVQKTIINESRRLKKFSITATEMLLSIMHKTRPEMSEVSDIANAVFDGSDAVMLSEETAIGENPVLAVKIMKKVIIEAEKNKNKYFHRFFR